MDKYPSHILVTTRIQLSDNFDYAQLLSHMPHCFEGVRIMFVNRLGRFMFCNEYS